MRGLKVVPMDPWDPLDTNRFPWKSGFSNREGFSLKLSIFYGSEYLISFVCVCVFWFTRANFLFGYVC